MAPPLVKGRALARRRIAGVVFLVVLGMLLQTSVWMYQKRFVDVVEVALSTDRAGNQLSVHADVKLRGIVVGEVRKVSQRGDHAVLDLALKPDKARLVPRDVRAQLLPKTLFGEKQVVLVPVPGSATEDHLRDGDTITQDRSSTALETETALNDLLPLLRALKPEALSVALNALSEALRGRGDRLGNNFAQAQAYFARFNPSLPQLGEDMQGLADLSDTIASSTPDIIEELDSFAASSRNLVEEQRQLSQFLSSTKDFATTARDVVAENEQRFIALAQDSAAPLELYATYSNTYPCFLHAVAFQEIEGERVFGGGQTGLHITLEATRDKGGYRPGDEPQYKEGFNARCFGLTKKVIPMPEFRNSQDGYRDSDPPADPGEGPGGCCRRGEQTTAEDWAPELAVPPAQLVVQRRAMPAGSTVLDALLLGPIAGSS